MSNTTAATADPADDYRFAELAPGADLSGLEPRQSLALWTLLTTGNVTSAAKTAGVQRRSVLYWMRSEPRFAAGLRAARARIIAANQKRVAAGLEAASGRVAEAVDPDEKHPVPDKLLRLLRIV